MELTIEQSWLKYWYITLNYKRIWLLPNGVITTCSATAEGENWKTKAEAQQFLDNWLPQKDWLTADKVKAAAKLGELEALDCSIEHWKQIVLDLNVFIRGNAYCAICIRGCKKQEETGKDNCTHCVLNNYTRSKFNCCKEYENFIDDKTESNAIAMLNKLVKIRNKKYGSRRYGNPKLQYGVDKIDYSICQKFFGGTKMSNETLKSNTIKIDGKEFSEETVKEALKKHCDFENAETATDVEYQFKAGDVVESKYGHERVIIKVDNRIYSINVEDGRNVGSKTQKEFEKFNYKKIGELKDYIR